MLLFLIYGTMGTLIVMILVITTTGSQLGLLPPLSALTGLPAITTVGGRPPPLVFRPVVGVIGHSKLGVWNHRPTQHSSKSFRWSAEPSADVGEPSTPTDIGSLCWGGATSSSTQIGSEDIEVGHVGNAA